MRLLVNRGLARAHLERLYWLAIGMTVYSPRPHLCAFVAIGAVLVAVAIKPRCPQAKNPG